MSVHTITAVLESIRLERARQEQLCKAGRFPVTPAAPRDSHPAASESAKLAVLLEEVGEVAREVNEALIDGNRRSPLKLYDELVQVAAVAVAWCEALQVEDMGAEPTKDSVRCNSICHYDKDADPCVYVKGHEGQCGSGRRVWSLTPPPTCGVRFPEFAMINPGPCTLQPSHEGMHRSGTFQWADPEKSIICGARNDDIYGHCILTKDHPGNHATPYGGWDPQQFVEASLPVVTALSPVGTWEENSREFNFWNLSCDCMVYRRVPAYVSSASCPHCTIVSRRPPVDACGALSPEGHFDEHAVCTFRHGHDGPNHGSAKWGGWEREPEKARKVPLTEVRRDVVGILCVDHESWSYKCACGHFWTHGLGVQRVSECETCKTTGVRPVFEKPVCPAYWIDETAQSVWGGTCRCGERHVADSTKEAVLCRTCRELFERPAYKTPALQKFFLADSVDDPEPTDVEPCGSIRKISGTIAACTKPKGHGGNHGIVAIDSILEWPHSTKRDGPQKLAEVGVDKPHSIPTPPHRCTSFRMIYAVVGEGVKVVCDRVLGHALEHRSGNETHVHYTWTDEDEEAKSVMPKSAAAEVPTAEPRPPCRVVSPHDARQLCERPAEHTGPHGGYNGEKDYVQWTSVRDSKRL